MPKPVHAGIISHADRARQVAQLNDVYARIPGPAGLALEAPVMPFPLKVTDQVGNATQCAFFFGQVCFLLGRSALVS